MCGTVIVKFKRYKSRASVRHLFIYLLPITIIQWYSQSLPRYSDNTALYDSFILSHNDATRR